MVDQESLHSLKEERKLAESPDPPKKLPPVKVRVVDAGRSAYSLAKFPPPRSESDEDDEDGEGEEADEAARDDGWMWVEVKFLLSFYETVQADQGWDQFYERPPKVYGRN
ncbi:hypothetical protein NX059_006702 [Plenodomus lindquistii]|nr:hypothetical protein NX059_006702 [Plenodomus lindquistii]